MFFNANDVLHEAAQPTELGFMCRSMLQQVSGGGALSVETRSGAPLSGPNDYGYIGRYYSYTSNTGYITRENAKRVVAQFKQAMESSGNVWASKYIRPWQFTTRTFPAIRQMRMGVEIELGFRSSEARRAARNWLLGVTDAVFDCEGAGQYPLEATFAPCAFNALLHPKSKVLQYLDFVRESTVSHSREAQVGTHINLSTTAIASTSNRTPNLVARACEQIRAWFLNDAYCEYEPMESIRDIVHPATGHHSLSEVRNKLFGRNPYGGAYHHYGHRGNPGWIELKLFNSTTDTATFKHYTRVAAAIGRTLDKVARRELAESQEINDYLATQFVPLIRNSPISDI